PAVPMTMLQSVIVLRNGDDLLGVIADEVVEVATIGQQAKLMPFENGLVFVPLADDYLPKSTWDVDPLSGAPSMDAFSEGDGIELRSRALTAAQQTEDDSASVLTPLAIVEIGGCTFAVELNLIREFAPLRGLTKVPCCPSHILGNVNLRGEV